MSNLTDVSITQPDECLETTSKTYDQNNNFDFDFTIFKNKIIKNYKQIAISRKLRKFYRKRYQLFSLFDSGILLDNESWFSVTPEQVAKHIAQKCFEKMGSRSDLVILDAFCGSGGNTIAFAQLFEQVISCDIDFTKLQCAQHNAFSVYNEGHHINFVMQDFFQLHTTLKSDQQIDCIFLSPPWYLFIFIFK
jgi:trimethylguanosine synthase